MGYRQIIQIQSDIIRLVLILIVTWGTPIVRTPPQKKKTHMTDVNAGYTSIHHYTSGKSPTTFRTIFSPGGSINDCFGFLLPPAKAAQNSVLLDGAMQHHREMMSG